jgi:cytochrome c
MTPIPNDIPLPLPAPEPLLVVLLVAFFLLHILFVNLMVGGSLLTVFYQVKGLKDDRYDRIAHEIANTVTVNKSLAVVLGVGPLLVINTLYTVYFYSANALTGNMWLSIVPLVIIAFLLTYFHKYRWDAMASKRRLHIAIAAAASGLFLFIPLIFLTNINLMLFPARWTDVQGFLSALFLQNVFPRYFHFVLASLAVTGLFIVWLFRRAAPEKVEAIGFEQAALVRIGYRWALISTLAQFVVGPLVLLTLPAEGLANHVVVTILTGAIVAMPALGLLLVEVRSPPTTIGRRFWPITILLAITVTFMATGRHAYREASISPHRDLVRIQTEQYLRATQQAREAEQVSKDTAQ